jgi:hypothetical protein
MATGLELESAESAVVKSGGARIAGAAWPVNSERPLRSDDCASMARMPLSTLLYYVLVGNGPVGHRQA